MRVAVLLVVLGAIAAAFGNQLLGLSPSRASSSSSSSSSRAASPTDVRRSEHRDLRSGRHGALGEADGAVPDGTTVLDAVDIGPSGAAAWLSEHGAAFGLCQVYGNEPWHYELRPEAIDHGCPAVYADPTHDPRMQR
jgi:hypothetical protein